MRVLVTGGGTGGHIYPALAIARGLQSTDKSIEVLYVGTAKGLEAEIVPRTEFPFRTVTVEGLPRTLGWPLVSSLFKIPKGFVEALKIIKEFKPSVVIGTGGYVCGPVVLAAVLRRIPTMIHEQNALPGVTNKLLARIVDKVAVTFPQSVSYFKKRKKIVVTGLPVRPEIVKAIARNRDKNTTLRGFNILVVGGSRGARSINLSMVEVIKTLNNKEGVNILHVTGQAGYGDFIKGLKDEGIQVAGNIAIKEYLHEMPEALSAADLIICRAGATTIAEVTALGVPSILIPYPYAAENHQEYNARALVEKNAAVMIKDAELSGPRLVETIEMLMNDQDKLKLMAQNAKEMGRLQALEKIIGMVRELGGLRNR